ncbi:hypothetical protein [Anaerosolibacter sp.]|uniref:hypothetical protein n=1 Tax=Anaerosolibacter sp. TaxID=1872527 RepID=UPI0039F10B08
MKSIRFMNIWGLRAYRFLVYLGHMILIFTITTVVSRMMEVEAEFFLKDLLIIGLILSALFLSLFPRRILFKRMFPDHDGFEIMMKVAEYKNMREKIYILEQAVHLEKISPNEKLWMLKDIAEYYKELKDENKATEYYTKVEKKTQEILETQDTSTVVKIEAMGQLAVHFNEHKEFEKSIYYFDEILKHDLEENGVFFQKDILKSMLEAYLLNQQKQRAIQIYDSLLRQKRCKRNKVIERMLQI